MQTHEILSKDGLKLFSTSHPAKKAQASIVLVHGFAEHSGRYSHVIAALNAAGFDVLSIDFRGHGLSEGKRGYIDFFAQYIDDLDAAVAYAKDLFSVQKVYICAHSMGALVATFYTAAFKQNVAGLIASSPFFGIKITVPAHKKFVGEIMSKLVPTFTLSASINGSEVSNDKKMAELYDSDPMIFSIVRARWFTEIARAQSMLGELLSTFSTPLLFQVAGTDLIANSANAIAWFNKCKSADKELIIYDGFYHEIYNEIERARPIKDMINWLQARQKQQ